MVNIMDRNSQILSQNFLSRLTPADNNELISLWGQN